MIKNLFKTAWRNVYRQRSYTLINIIGLGRALPFASLFLC
jgi:putative ABC transport system permease protein